MSTKIQALLKTMQGRATRYLMHLEPYISFDGKSSVVAVGSDQPVRDALFVQDIIGLLDGPAQRAAEAELDQYTEDLKAVVRGLLEVLHVVDHVVTIRYPDGSTREVLASAII